MSRKKPSPSSMPAVDGRHNMTSLELSEADDLATLMTVDSILGFTTHKMDKNFNPGIYDKKLRDRWKEIMEEFIVELNYENTYQQMVFTDKLKPHWKKDERFKRHIFRFLYLFDKRSGIEVRPCYRYENEEKLGAAIFATREWERGSQISTLFGCISEVRPSEEEFFHETKNEFSVMYSTRKNCSQLWLGPAAYVNHDCKPNCRFTEANYDSKMTLETLRDIHPNDELLIYYGNNFFGIDNAECECFTCELRGQGFFNYNNVQQQNNLCLNGISIGISGNQNNRLCFSSPVMNSAMGIPVVRNSNNEYSDSNRRVITRSSKAMDSEDCNGLDSAGTRITLPHTFHGALNELKNSDNSYSLRITYSRIDRVKQNILSRGHVSISNNHSHFGNSEPAKLSLKDKLKRKNKLVISSERKSFKEKHPVATISKTLSSNNSTVPESQIAQRRSLRQANAKNLSTKPDNPIVEPQISVPLTLEEGHSGKLTIKLRKTADHPNQYEHCVPTTPRPPIQKLTIKKRSKLRHSNSRDPDSNIFSRMTQLYLLRPENATPPQSDTPPFLSPWFCSEKSSSHSSRKSKAKIKLKAKPLKSSLYSSNHLKIVNINRKPAITNCCDNNSYDFCLNIPETSSSDIPSYSASSPTIPILEIESETELVPPQLVCELQEPQLTQPSRNKGIVMKFSRICGNRFISLLS